MNHQPKSEGLAKRIVPDFDLSATKPRPIRETPYLIQRKSLRTYLTF